MIDMPLGPPTETLTSLNLKVDLKCKKNSINLIFMPSKTSIAVKFRNPDPPPPVDGSDSL